MRVDDLQAELRERGALETMDLGVAMARTWAGDLARAWIRLVLPLHGACLLLAAVAPWWALALLWWSQPFAERALLFTLSRRLFGVRLDGPALLRAIPTFWGRGLWRDLSLRRLLPWRVFLQPVEVLEGLTGERARQRRRDLLEGQHAALVGLGLIAGLAELGAVVGLLTFLSWVVAEPQRVGLEVLADRLAAGLDPWLPVVLVALVLSGALVLPLRVASAFALYLQRRTRLEGWDVELALRRIARRLVPGAALAICVALLLGAAEARAGSPVEREQQARAELARILEDPAFGGEVEVPTLRLRWELPKVEERAPLQLPFVGSLLGSAARVLLFVSLGLLALGLVLAILRRVRVEEEGGRGPARSGRIEQGRLGESRILPAHPAEEAWRLWAAGRRVPALGLLYASAVAWLVELRGLDLPASATEGDCLRLGRRHLPARPLAYLERLTRAWQQAAYAHRLIDDEQMRGLVRDWPELGAEAP